MKQIIQSYKTGQLSLADVPVPALRSGGVLVQNVASAVSIGTEKLMMDMAKKSLLGKAKARPDLVREVISKAKSDGIKEAYRASMGRLDSVVALGYSCAGRVIEVAPDVNEFSVSDPVACFGANYASHGEVVSVPRNLVVKLSEDVGFDAAAFAGVGGIALHAVRTAEVNLGDRVVVVGLGLLGLIAVQVLAGAGAHVFGVDIDSRKVQLARELGAEGSEIVGPQAQRDIMSWTEGQGADAVLVFASAESAEPVTFASEVARDRARLVVPGMVDLKLARRLFYEKELRLTVSRSAGAGIYDPLYEEKGLDYPLPYVRWTARRNMEEFLSLVARGKVGLERIITHRYPIDDAVRAYDTISRGDGASIGVLISYETSSDMSSRIAVREPSDSRREPREKLGVGLIGAGLHAKVTLLPILKRVGRVTLRGVATASGISSRHTADKFGFQYCTSNFQDILDDSDVDCVLIATRHDLHVPMTVAALIKGKDVFVEKPLATTPKGLLQVVEEYNTGNSQLMVGFNRRFSPFSLRARQALEGRSTPAIINMRINAGPVLPDSWVLDPVEGGGRVIGEVCHFVDLAHYLTGCRSVRVYARPIHSDGSEVADANVAITMDMEDGSVVSIVYVSAGDRRYPRERVEIFWEGAVCAIDNFRQLELVRDGHRQRMRRRNVDRGHKSQLETFFRAVQGEAIPLPFEEYAATTLTTFAIVESMRSGVPEDVDAWDLGVRS